MTLLVRLQKNALITHAKITSKIDYLTQNLLPITFGEIEQIRNMRLNLAHSNLP